MRKGKEEMRSKVNLMKVESGGTGVPPVRFGVPPKLPRVFFTPGVCGERRAGRPPRQAGGLFHPKASKSR